MSFLKMFHVKHFNFPIWYTHDVSRETSRTSIVTHIQQNLNHKGSRFAFPACRGYFLESAFFLLKTTKLRDISSSIKSNCIN